MDLDRVQLQSTAKVEWAGPREESSSEEGLDVASRRFGALLDPSGPPGERRAEIMLKRGDEVLDRQTVSWEVVSPLAASPKVIALRPGQNGYRVVIESARSQAFSRDARRVQGSWPEVSAQGRCGCHRSNGGIHRARNPGRNGAPSLSSPITRPSKGWMCRLLLSNEADSA